MSTPDPVAKTDEQATAAARLHMELTIQAAVIATVIVIEENIERDPKSVQVILRGAWDLVEVGIVIGQIDVNGRSQMRLLHEYFHHSGDWKAMRDCLMRGGEKAQTEPQQLSRLIDEQLQVGRTRYAALFGQSGRKPS